MKAEGWKKIDDVFHAVLEREPERRGAFIDEVCAGDATLRKEVESLIASHDELRSRLVLRPVPEP